MEWIVVAILAVGVGVLATVVLATCLPVEVHDRAREHGRFAHLGEAAQPASLSRADTEAAPRMSAYAGTSARRAARARARHPADAVREALRRRGRLSTLAAPHAQPTAALADTPSDTPSEAGVATGAVTCDPHHPRACHHTRHRHPDTVV